MFVMRIVVAYFLTVLCGGVVSCARDLAAQVSSPHNLVKLVFASCFGAKNSLWGWDFHKYLSQVPFSRLLSFVWITGNN